MLQFNIIKRNIMCFGGKKKKNNSDVPAVKG